MIKQGSIPMTCMARNSDEIGAQVPASTGERTKCSFPDKKNLFMIKKSCIFLTTLHVFKKYACEKKCPRVTLSW